MGEIDLHIHTVKSPCGLHTLLEILELAHSKGMSLVAITDHDHGEGHAVRVLSYRFPDSWKGMRVLSGIELSIRDGGVVRVPPLVKLKDLDICLAGFHADTHVIRDDPRQCTDDLEAALTNYPFIDILTHPTLQGFDLEHQRCAELLARHGVAVEVNNSALLLGKEDPERLLGLLTQCVKHRVPVAVNSDAHTASELGGDELAWRLLGRAQVPPELVLTTSVKKVLAFLEKRREHKLSFPE